MPAAHHRASSSRPGRDPLAGVTRLVLDVDNVLGALPRSGTTISPTALLGRLRAVVPPGGRVELIFDGPRTRGGTTPGPGMLARYAAPRTADDVIVDLVRAAGPPEPGDDPAILVVTDDNALRRAVRDLGGATAGTAWLIGRLERTVEGAPSVGRPRPPASPAEPDEDRRGWRPGRGATVKRGNPRRTGRRGGR